MTGFCLELNSKIEMYVNLISTMSNRESNTASDPLFIHPHLTSGLNTILLLCCPPDTHNAKYRDKIIFLLLNTPLSIHPKTSLVFHDKP